MPDPKLQMSEILKTDPFVAPSFSLANRLLRFLWSIVYLLFFRYSPRPLHGWRGFLLRCFGADLGRHVHIYPAVKIWAPWNLVVGDFVGVGDGATLYSMGRITIGDYVTVSQGVHLCAGSHDYNSPNFQLFVAPINIGKQVWICAEAFVGPGVSVGDGAVIGARAVLFKDAESLGVYVGNPAKLVKYRLSLNL